jgi:hypothetical protein
MKIFFSCIEFFSDINRMNVSMKFIFDRAFFKFVKDDDIFDIIPGEIILEFFDRIKKNI